MSRPTVSLELALTTNPGTTPSWTSMTASPNRFITAEIEGGRERELDTHGARTGTFTLDDDDRYLDPSNTSAPAPYNGNVLPTRESRFRATWASVTYDLFRGLNEDYAIGFDGGKRTVQIAATDGFKVLAAANLPASEWDVDTDKLVPRNWWGLGEAEGEPAFDRAGTMPGVRQGVVTPADALVINGSDGAAEFASPGGRIYITGASLPATPFTIVGRFRYDGTDQAIFGLFDHQILHAAGIFDVVGIYVSSGSLGGSQLWFQALTSAGVNVARSSVTVLDGLVHTFVLVLRANGTMKVYIDGIDRTTQTSGPVAMAPSVSSISIGSAIDAATSNPWIGVIDEPMVFDRELSSTEAAAFHTSAVSGWTGDLSGARVTRILDAIGWPAGMRSIDAGQSVMQTYTLGGSALAYLQKVAESEDGEFYMTGAGSVRFVDRHARLKPPRSDVVAIFENQTGANPFSDLAPEFSENDIYNAAVLAREGGPTFTAEDTTAGATNSIARHFRRTYEATDLMLASDLEVQDRAAWIVLNRKDARMRIASLVLRPQLDDALWPLALGLTFGDRVQVIGNIIGGGAVIDKICVIERIAHSITNRTWTTTFGLSEAPALSCLVLDDAEQGALDEGNVLCQ